MAALDAGAHHVTAVERWLYLSLTCKETLKLNGFDEDRFKVIYKRPTDLKLQTDVPILCNLLVCDILDEGEVTSVLRSASPVLTVDDSRLANSRPTRSASDQSVRRCLLLGGMLNTFEHGRHDVTCMCCLDRPSCPCSRTLGKD